MRPASILTVVLVTALTPAAARAEAAPADRAATLLAEAREALGGATRLNALRSLSATGTLRRVVPEPGTDPRELDGEATIDVLLPGRYRRSESLSFMAGAPAVTIATALDGEQAWTGPVGGGRAGVMIRVAEAGGSAPGTLRERVRTDMARWLLATALLTTADQPLAFTHGGEAESPDGKADVLDVRGPDGFAARLFLDTTSHRPLMLTFQETPTRMAFRTMRPGGHGMPAPGGPAEVAAPPPAPVEARLFVSEWRKVGDVWLPHLVTKTLENGLTEELQVKAWRLDPPLTADHFQKKP